MSLLLEALQRSRREARESRGGVPDLDTVTAPPEHGGDGKASVVRILVPTLIIATLLAWVLRDVPGVVLGALTPQREPDTLTERTAQAPVEQERQAVKAEAPAVSETRPQPQPQHEIGVANLPAKEGEPASGEGSPRVSAEVTDLYKNSGRHASEYNASADGGQMPAGDAGSGDGAPLDIEAMVQQAEKSLSKQKLEEHSSPLLEELTQSLKDALPTLMYLRHDYRGGGGSQVTINRREAGTGESVAPGVEVVEILTDAVVLRFQGQVFRLRALNSWVNL